MENYHKSVLTDEVIEGLALKTTGVYIDATFGGGGHTRAILESEPTAQVLAIDWDKTAIEKNGPELEKSFKGRIKIVHANFARLHFVLKKERLSRIDGILADFGTSQHQIHHKEGFSFFKESPLDMRMSPQYQRVTAAHVINSFTQKAELQAYQVVELEDPNAEANVTWINTVVDFGKIEKNKPTTANFKFKNTGNKPVLITKANGSCGCTGIKYSKEPVKAGETATIQATYNAASLGAFSKTVTVELNIENSRKVLRLKGEVVHSM